MARRGDDIEFEFDDDDAFDELPSNTLHQLEEQAFLSTQKAGLGSVRPQIQAVSQHAQLPSSEYGSGDYDEEDVIDLNAEPISLPPVRTLPTRDGRNDHPPSHREQSFKPASKANGSFRQPTRTAAAVPALGRLNGSQVGQQSQTSTRDSHEDIDIQTLLAQVEKLRQQNENLQKASKDHEAAAQTKAGEAALLRRKIEATSNEYEKRLQREREAHNQAFNRQKAQLDLAVREKKKVEDNNRFLEHDLKQAHATTTTKRTVTGAKDASVGSLASFDEVITPKKINKNLLFRDGFDDEDVMAVSPSKARLKQTTPKKAGKRKRDVDQSPAKTGSLEFAEPVGSPSVSFSREDSERTTVLTTDAANRGVTSSKQFELLQRLLNHRPVPYGEDRFIEVASTFMFPSNPTLKLSSFVMNCLQVLPQSEDAEMDILTTLSKLWERCLDETYYAPLNVVVTAIRSFLGSISVSIASNGRIILLPLIMRTVDLVAIPIGLAGKNASTLPDESAAIEKQIDVEQCLRILNHIALSCVRTKSERAEGSAPLAGEATELKTALPVIHTTHIQSFWQSVQFDFILVLLMKGQSKQVIHTVLSLLRLSSLPYTFGTISVKSDGEVDHEKQTRREDATLHRLLDLLFEGPKPLKGREEQAWDQTDLAILRLDVLAVFQSMCAIQTSTRSRQSHGSKLLAHHPRAVGKLFRFLSDTVNLLYTYLPLSLDCFGDNADNEPTPHALAAQAVNTTMRILHHLIASFGNELDVRQKLAAIPGGHHRHLVSLSRLAFSDQILLDAGIDDGTVDAAHEMLDNYLTYEEGESLVALFSTPTSKAVDAAGEPSEGKQNEEMVPKHIGPNNDEEMENVDAADDDNDTEL